MRGSTTRRHRRSASDRPRKTVYTALAGGLAVALAATGCSTGADLREHDGLVELRLADSFSTTHPIGRSGTEIFREILSTEGREVGLDFIYFGSGQLGVQRDMPAVVRTGIAEIAAVSPAYVGTQLPLSNVGDLPGFTGDACVGGDAMRDIMQPGGTLFEEELKQQDLLPLWVAYIPGYEAMTGSIPLNSPDDVSNTVLRATGGAADRVIDGMGAAGTSMPIGDLYEALSRDTVAGTLASPLSITPYRLEEVLHHSTDGANLGSFTVTYSISYTVWQELSDEQQSVLSDASDTAQDAVCEEINKSMDESKQAMRDAGVVMHEVTAEQRDEWDRVTAPVRDSWVHDLESTGRPAAIVLREFEQALVTAGSSRKAQS